MHILVTSTYLIILCLWLAVLAMVCITYRRSPRIFGATRLLLAVVAIDTTRNIIENAYFGLYFLSRYKIITGAIASHLDHTYFLIIPKLVNIAAACAVIILLLRRWLPMAQRERRQADEEMRQTAEALAGANEAQRVLSQERNYLSNFDPATGLPNQQRLQADLRSLAAGPMNSARTSLALVVIEVDGFKDITHSLGHVRLKAFLREVANRITTLMEGSLRCYRVADGEFAVIFPNTDRDTTLEIIRSLLKRLGDDFDIDDCHFFTTASAGVVFADKGSPEGDDLLTQANLALCDARAAGGGILRLYSPTLRAKALARLELEAELGRAHREREFVLYFQPQVRLIDGGIVGAEALLRWHHPERGVLTPATFINALARSPIAADVGRWILETACKTAAGWQARGLPQIRIGVNLFPIQYRDGGLLRDIEQALAQSGLPATALEIEITEDVVLDDNDATIDMLRGLRAVGIGLAADDFGTGYASLSYLARYPLNRIKIDRSFMAGIGDVGRDRDTAMVRSIIAMANNLKLGVVAEGVETATQAAFLRSAGCEEAQGFLYARALDEKQFEEFLAEKQDFGEQACRFPT